MIGQGWKKWLVLVMVVGIMTNQIITISVCGAELLENALEYESLEDMYESVEEPAQNSISSGDAQASVSSGENIETDNAEVEITVDSVMEIQETYGSAMAYASTESIPAEYCNILADTNRLYQGSKSSSVAELPDGGYQTTIYYNGKLYVTNFNKAFQVTASKEITMELPSWKGVFFGPVFNYAVCMDYNKNLSDGDTAFDIIKYDKDFNKIGNLSLSGDEAKAYGLYSMGDISMDETNGILTIYKSKVNGAGIPSATVLCVNTDDMSINKDYQGQ